MPQLKSKQPLEKIVLPESSSPDEEAFVMMDTDPRGGDMLDALSKNNFDEINRFEVGLRLVVNLVKEWNFTDEQGQPVPVSLENVKLLPAGDITVMMEKLQSLQGITSSKKKT